MGCVLMSVLFGLPRLALVVIWASRDGYLSAAFGSWLLPLMGFFFLPYTTLGFAIGINSLGAAGEMPPLGWLFTLLGLAADLGLTGRGAVQARRRRSAD